MHEIQIYIVGVEVFQAGIACCFDDIGPVRVVPELGDEEDFFARYAGLLDAFGDAGFGAVAFRSSVIQSSTMPG